MQAAHHAASGQQHPGGTLYVVATPIGNLADLTLRAIHVLQLVDAVACEDTRVTARLLQHLGLNKRLLALHEHNEATATAVVLEALGRGERVAYVSDAGTPAVSDPGAGLVQRAHEAGYRVMPIPGASSVVAALSAAGDAGSPGHAFFGFLPTKAAARRQALQEALAGPLSLVLFEAPHRIRALADELAAAAAGRSVTVCRELTKQFESIATLQAQDLPAWLAADANRERGEFVVVVHALAEVAQQAVPPQAEALLQALLPHHPLKLAARLVADATGVASKALYERGLAWREQAAASEHSDGSAD